jgi:hypothetical protein
MGEHGMTEYYKEKLEAGLIYQDFVADQLRKDDPCIIIGAYSSSKYQNEHGESMSGIEIKHDMLMKNTGNLYIEVAEKSNANLPDYTPSGIMRNDNTWLYLIGDYEQAFLFSKHQLKTLYADERNYSIRGIRKKQTPTSIGFVYPIDSAMKGMCLRRFVFSK